MSLACSQRQCGGQARAAAGRAVDVEPAAERSDPVGEPYQPLTIGIGAADAVDKFS
jgi:hypothetical protein